MYGISHFIPHGDLKMRERTKTWRGLSLAEQEVIWAVPGMSLALTHAMNAVTPEFKRVGANCRLEFLKVFFPKTNFVAVASTPEAYGSCDLAAYYIHRLTTGITAAFSTAGENTLMSVNRAEELAATAALAVQPVANLGDERGASKRALKMLYAKDIDRVHGAVAASSMAPALSRVLDL